MIKLLFKQGLILILLSLLALTSCDKKDYHGEYSAAYDELFTFYVNIDTLASHFNVKTKDLVLMRYGALSPEGDITEKMCELLEAYKKYDKKKVSKILSKEYDFKKPEKNENFSKASLDKQYKTAVYVRNEKFDKGIPELIGSEMSNSIESFMNKEFKWYRFPINAWNLVAEGKDGLRERYNKTLDDMMSTRRIDKEVVSRFNDYGFLIAKEQKVLFARDMELPTLKSVSLENTSNIADEKVVSKMIDRCATDLTDTELTIVEELGIGILIWLVFRFLANRITNIYADKVLGYDVSYGWWNLGFFALNLYNKYLEEEEKKHLRTIKRWVQSIIFIIFLVIGYFYVMKPQGKIEDEIIAAANNNIAAYVEKLDINILEYFNNVIAQL